MNSFLSLRRAAICLALAAFSLLPAVLRAAPPPDAPPDLILFNGKIITVDANDSVAQALAIRDGRILAVGSNDTIRKLAAPSTRLVDLHGLTATPGLIDAHCHFDEISQLYSIDLSGVKNIPEAMQLVQARVAKTPPGDWVVGAGWDESKLAELRYITAADLDAVSPNNPVWLTHTTGHYGVANSAALKLAKVDATTKNPPTGVIDHTPDGRLSGVLKEGPAMDLVTSLIPPYTREQERNGILKIMADFNSEGMTAAKDPGIDTERWEIYRELLNEQKFTVRVFALFLGGTTMNSAEATLATLRDLPRPPLSLDNGLLFAGGVKLFMDGSGGGRTAWVYEPWHIKSASVDAGNTGYPNIDPDTYRLMVQLFHNAGIHVSTHAVGDRAIDWVVDTYAFVLDRKPTTALRHGVIHDVLPTEHAIAMTQLLETKYDSGYPELQAPFLWWIGDTYAGTFGPDRVTHLLPLKTYERKGIRWAGGSDFFVTPFPARYGLWASVERKTLNGVYGSQPFGTAESVDIHTALKSYTIWAAHQLFLEDRVGSLEPGKDADIAVWDRDMYSIPSDQLKDLKCQLTLLRGKEVYRAPEFPAAPSASAAKP